VGEGQQKDKTKKWHQKSSLYFIRGKLGDALGMHPVARAHLNETLHQVPQLKSEDLYFREIPIFGKMPTF